MTESLKCVLVEQAASVAFKPPDLDVIARDSTRRIRRRRAVATLAAAATVVVLAGTAVIVSTQPNRRPDLADNRPAAAASWAIGSTIHDGHGTIEVGHEVRALVRTSVGFVTVDGANNVYSVAGRSVTRIGQAFPAAQDGGEQVRLVSDPHGSLAGWIGQDGSHLVLYVYDQAIGRTHYYGAEGAGFNGVDFFAIDDRTAYWRIADRGAFAVNLDTGEQRQLANADEARYLKIWSVESRVLAFSPDQDPRGNVTSLRVGPALDNAREFTFGENAEADDTIRLSPTAAWIAYLRYEFNGPPIRDDVRAVDAQVRDTATGEQVALTLPKQSYAVPVMWLDDTTLQVVVFGPESAMWTCVIPDGFCSVVSMLSPDEIEGSALVLPNGTSVTN